MGMDSEEMDRVLEQGLAGESAQPAFRARVLEDSLAALAGRRHRYIWRHSAALAAAAVLIAGVSFLGGRYSVVRWETAAPPGNPPVAQAGGTVVVPGELVEWVNAARLFKQLGMEDRMAHAVDRAGRLMPADLVGTCAPREPIVAVRAEVGPPEGEETAESGVPAPRRTSGGINRVMAQSWGD
jgi:hypothetical protein